MRRLVAILALVVAAVAAPPAGAAIEVAITSPADGAHSLSGIVPVKINASADVGIYGVQLYVDGQPYGAVDTFSVDPYRYEIAWDTSTVAVGSHTLAANAIDWSQIGGGVQQLSAPITVDVGPPYPTVSLTGPAAWTLVRGTVQVSASVTSVGETSVRFAVDGSPLGTVTAAPWTASWDTTATGDGSHTVTATVTDGRGKQDVSAATVTVDNTAPTTSVVAPEPDAFATGTLAVKAHASDAYGIATVQLAIDGEAPGSPIGPPDADSPYTYSATLDVSALADGTTHRLTVLATDRAGNSKTSEPVSFAIGTPPPAVTIAAPLDGELARGTVSVTAAVTGGTLPIKATLVVDGKATTQTATVAPYTFLWDTTKLADGAHTVTVSVVDASGRSASSPAVRQTVDNTKPSAVVYKPPANARVDGPITLQVHASDANGVESVQFTVDGAPVGSLLTDPDAGEQYLYSTTFDASTLAPGTHAVSALVTDRAGNAGTAAPVSITAGPIEYLPVINYHEIDPPDGNAVYDQTLAEADQQLAYLKANGYRSVTLEQYRQWIAGGSIGIAKPVLITVDDGLKSELAWDALLQKYGFTAVLFVVTGFADNKTPGSSAADNMTWTDIQGLARTGRWQIAFHAGEYGHGDSYDSGATITTSAGRLRFSAACPYFYTCLGTVTTRFFGRTRSRAETFQEYQSRVTRELDAGVAELRWKVPGANTLAWAAPFNDAGQWVNLYNDPSGQVQSWFPGAMAARFPVVFTQTNPVTYGQASGTVGSLSGFNRRYRLEVHTDTTIQQFAAALTDPAFAR